MTIEQIKAEAKARSGHDITDEQAQALLERYPGGTLPDEVLAGVAAGQAYVPRHPKVNDPVKKRQ